MNRLNYEDMLKIAQRYQGLFRRVGMKFYFSNTNISTHELYFQMISSNDVLIDDNYRHDYDGNTLRLRISKQEDDGLLLLNESNMKLSDKECAAFYKYNIDIQPNAFVRDKFPDFGYDRVQIMRKVTINNIIND